MGLKRQLIGWMTLCVGLLGLLASCVSRSAFTERVEQSSGLTDPTFTIALADPNHFSFAMVGDLHISGRNTDRFARILNQASLEGDQFVVLLGDMADTGDREEFEAMVAAVNAAGFSGKVLYVIGNHDIFADGWSHYKTLLGRSFYSVTIGNSKFVILDTADGTVGETQTEWLREDLKKPKPTHTFLLSHYLPVIPTQRTYLKLSNEVEAQSLMKLAINHGIDGWFGGHYHSYLKDVIGGVTYVVAGGAGGRRMEPVDSHFFVQVSVNGSAVDYALRLVD